MKFCECLRLCQIRTHTHTYTHSPHGAEPASSASPIVLHDACAVCACNCPKTVLVIERERQQRNKGSAGLAMHGPMLMKSLPSRQKAAPKSTRSQHVACMMPPPPPLIASATALTLAAALPLSLHQSMLLPRHPSVSAPPSASATALLPPPTSVTASPSLPLRLSHCLSYWSTPFLSNCLCLLCKVSSTANGF